MTATKTKPRQNKPLPVEIPPAPAQQEDFEQEDFEQKLDVERAKEGADEAKTADAADVADGEVQSEHLRSSATSAVDSPASASTPSADRAHLDKIKAARAVVADRERTYLSRKSQAKQAKEAFEEAVADLTAVIDDGQEILPLFDSLPPETETAETEAPGPEPQNDAWRQVPVSELGLSASILEKLAEAGCETVGELEDRRASHKGLRSISGIGEKKITIIEDAIVAWLTKHRDAKVFAAAAEPKTGPPGDGEADEAHTLQIHERADHLDTGEPGVLEARLPDLQIWRDGGQAYGNGEPLETCSWMPGEQQDDWIRGWLWAVPPQ